MKKVLILGTFDTLHPGHLSLFRQAREHGDYLTVVIARDETIKEVKKREPVFNEEQRKANLEKLGIVKEVVLGNLEDKYKIIEDIKPDVICLGYDQLFFTENLEEELKKRNINSKIIKLNPYKEDVYKSSKLREDYNQRTTNAATTIKP
tara:strand:+ start:54 stop:500 length:447 start_codon:yes stop_codon:yes gene_type:complete